MSLRRLSRARAFPLLLAALLACATYAPVRAVANSEIPGTPLPASGQITSAVGGSLFDLVYAVDVPAASVLAISLRGEPGAELGLYLYGEGSTSILTALPLASSAKPGGVQSVSVRFIRASTEAAVTLRFQEGLSPKEIAAHLGLPERTVRTHLLRGLRALKESVGDLK